MASVTETLATLLAVLRRPSALRFLLLAAVVWLALRARRFFRPPLRPRNMPAMPTIQGIIDLVSLTVPEKQAKFSKKYDYASPMYLFNSLGTWYVQSADPEVVKVVMQKTEVFNKLLMHEICGKEGLQVKLIGDNIVFSNGKDWTRHRKLSNPSFKNLSLYTDVFGRVGAEVVGLWQGLSSQSGGSCVLDVHQWMSRVTLEALGRSIFDCRFSALTDKPEPIVAAYHDAIKFLSNPILILWPWTKMFYPKLIKSMEQFDEMLHDIIRRKRKEVESAPAGQEMRDLVSTMIQAAMDETGPKITAKELRANSMSCALYFVAKYPEVQARVRKELADVMGADGDADRWPTFEEQQEFKYLTAVIYETLRLCPSIPRMPARRIVKEIQLGDTVLPAGSNLVVNIYAMNRHPRYWDDPDTFRPERFLDTSKAAEERRAAWIPFGLGVRSCIGQIFSLIEQRVILAQILRAFDRIELPEGSKHSENIVFNLGDLTLVPNKLELRFSRDKM